MVVVVDCEETDCALLAQVEGQSTTPGAGSRMVYLGGQKERGHIAHCAAHLLAAGIVGGMVQTSLRSTPSRDRRTSTKGGKRKKDDAFSWSRPGYLSSAPSLSSPLGRGRFIELPHDPIGEPCKGRFRLRSEGRAPRWRCHIERLWWIDISRASSLWGRSAHSFLYMEMHFANKVRVSVHAQRRKVDNAER